MRDGVIEADGLAPDPDFIEAAFDGRHRLVDRFAHLRITLSFALHTCVLVDDGRTLPRLRKGYAHLPTSSLLDFGYGAVPELPLANGNHVFRLPSMATHFRGFPYLPIKASVSAFHTASSVVLNHLRIARPLHS